MLICGVSALVAGILTLDFMETKDHPLADTIEDIDVRHQSLTSRASVTGLGDGLIVIEETPIRLSFLVKPKESNVEFNLEIK